MARPLRIEFPDAIYHVTSRCLEHQRLFADDLDYNAFRQRLHRAVELFALELYAYCLMPNHYHLFFATPKPNLSQALQWLNTAYTVWYKRHHAYRGHLFQGRFKAHLVEGEPYFAEVSRYIHLNPVRAHLAPTPEAWSWSSYRGYWRRRYEEPYVCYERVLSTYDGSHERARRYYRQFVDGGSRAELQSPWRSAWQGFALGTDAFIDRIIGLIEAKQPHIARDVTLVRKVKRRFSIEALKHAVARASGTKLAELHRLRRGKRDHPRRVAIYLARNFSDATGRQIASSFGLKSDGSLARLTQSVDKNDPLAIKTLKLLKCEIQV